MPIQPADFQTIGRVVFERSGIVLKAGKEYLVESRLEPVMRLKGIASFGELARALRGDRALEELVVEALTTNETSFFRDVRPFEALREAILPALFEQRAQDRAFHVWCAASSSGQEPFSLAMLLLEHFPSVIDWRLSFVATDISAKMVQRCEAGRYSQLEVSRGLPDDLRKRYFEARDAGFELVPRVRRLVRFQRLNLKEPFPSMPPLDLVLIRNVLIYFDESTKAGIIDRIALAMRPGGVLLLGAAEVVRHPRLRQDAHDRTRYYVKVGTPMDHRRTTADEEQAA